MIMVVMRGIRIVGSGGRGARLLYETPQSAIGDGLIVPSASSFHVHMNTQGIYVSLSSTTGSSWEDTPVSLRVGL